MAVQEKSRKRLLELDDGDEEQDAFDTDNSSAPRRGRKECRRISGVYREIKSLAQIGQDVSVMDLVFEKLSLKEVMLAGTVCPRWYIIACLTLRKRYGDFPIVRLWDAEMGSYTPLWINWELHFHEQLLDGTEVEDEPMEGCKPVQNNAKFPSIGTIVSVGSRSAFEQFVHEDAKLPVRQAHIFMTCADAIVTLPNFSYAGPVDSLFGLNSLSVQSVFIPKSKHFTINAFGLEILKEEWDIEAIKAKVELPDEDIGVGQKLQAILSVQYHDSDTTNMFINNIKSNYKDVALLAGYAEQVGCNSIGQENPVITGLAIYTGERSKVSVYHFDLDMMSDNMFLKLENQVLARPHSFCFVFLLDTRGDGDSVDGDDDDTVWKDSPGRPPSVVSEVVEKLRKSLPKTPIVGCNSWPSIVAQTVDPTNTNVEKENRHSMGVLLLSYE